ncbi:hypothetical protein ACHAWC_011750 [Mediolabrus comicus]
MQGFFSVVQIGDHAMHITNARRIIEFQQAESSKGRKGKGLKSLTLTSMLAEQACEASEK